MLFRSAAAAAAVVVVVVVVVVNDDDGGVTVSPRMRVSFICFSIACCFSISVTCVLDFIV